MNDSYKPQRALLSVSDKDGLEPLCQSLVANGVQLISTGGTYAYLKDKGFSVQKVEEVTDFPEIMDGRIKTLHPLLLGGLLGRRDKHASEASTFNIEWIDLLVCNLYPFETVIKDPNCSEETAIENIDIGGPTMLRAASKNFNDVCVLSTSQQYAEFISRLESGGIDRDYRKQLALDTFALTTRYDKAIIDHFRAEEEGARQELRYGENPHQRAYVERTDSKAFSVLNATVHQGKALSYNNLVDAEAAIECVSEFHEPACTVIKHATPCGVSVAKSIDSAFVKAFNADNLSAFGGIVALNQPCDKACADEIVQHFLEVVIAPSFSDDALATLAQKKNLRVLSLSFALAKPDEMTKILGGGILSQDADRHVATVDNIEHVAGPKVNDSIVDEMLFAWKLVKQVKSNAIVITQEGVSLGMSGGQVSRVDAVKQALAKANGNTLGAVLASDAFFPFRDSIDLLKEYGISAIIQPGGSIKDKEVIAACNEHQIAMYFTGVRCFKH